MDNIGIFIIFFVIAFTCIILRNVERTNTIIRRENQANKYAIILSTFLILIALLRDQTVGVDIIGYCNTFRNMQYIHFMDVPDYYSKDLLFYYFTNIISNFTKSHQIWFGIIAAMYIVPHTTFINKYSKDNILSFIILLSLGSYHFSLTGLRQAIALGLIALSYKYILENKLIKFILIVSFAAAFHITSLIFLIAYPISKLKLGIKQVVVVFGAFSILTVLGQYVLGIISTFTDTDRFGGYVNSTDTLNLSMTVIIFCVFIFCSFYIYKAKARDEIDVKLFNIFILAFAFQISSTIFAEFFRIAMYFNISLLCLIPNVFNKYEHNYNNKVIVNYFIYSIFTIYFFYSTVYSAGVYPYTFFW